MGSESGWSKLVLATDKRDQGIPTKEGAEAPRRRNGRLGWYLYAHISKKAHREGVPGEGAKCQYPPGPKIPSAETTEGTQPTGGILDYFQRNYMATGSWLSR